MAPRIDYKESVAEDLESLDPSLAPRILNEVERALRSEGKAGQPLTGEFEGLYRLGVGNCRVVYARTTEGYLVLRIARRQEVYSKGRPEAPLTPVGRSLRSTRPPAASAADPTAFEARETLALPVSGGRSPVPPRSRGERGEARPAREEQAPPLRHEESFWKVW